MQTDGRIEHGEAPGRIWCFVFIIVIGDMGGYADADVWWDVGDCRWCLVTYIASAFEWGVDHPLPAGVSHKRGDHDIKHKP